MTRVGARPALGHSWITRWRDERCYDGRMGKLVAVILATGMMMTGCVVRSRGAAHGGNGCGPGYHWNGGGCERDYARHDRGRDDDRGHDKDKDKRKDKDRDHDNGRGHDRD